MKYQCWNAICTNWKIRFKIHNWGNEFKKAKNEFLKRDLCAHLEFKAHYQTLKNTVVSISEVHILLQLPLKTTSTQNLAITKNIVQIGQETAKNSYLYTAFCKKNTFQSRKVIYWSKRMVRNFYCSEKFSSHGYFTLSLLGQNVWTNSTSCKKT